MVGDEAKERNIDGNEEVILQTEKDIEHLRKRMGFDITTRSLLAQLEALQLAGQQYTSTKKVAQQRSSSLSDPDFIYY